MPKYENIMERIAANSVVGDEITYAGEPCWLYAGKVDRRGYGLITQRVKSGPRKGQVINKRVHRESHKHLNNKRVSSKFVVRHGCNVRCCWNPKHLSGGSKASNSKDMVKAQRNWSGFQGPKPGEKEDSVQLRIQQRVRESKAARLVEQFSQDASYVEGDIA